MKTATRWVFLLLALVGTAATSFGQGQVPVISGGAVMLATENGSSTAIQPILTPVGLVPLGDHFLAETRIDLREFFFRANSGQPYSHQWFTTIDYLQLDYIANPHMTVTVGRFLTPFGMYNERLSAQWMRNLQDIPIIYEIGESPISGSQNGAMVRGSAYSNANFEINYAAFFGATSTVNKFESGRATGFRGGVFLPKARLEIGGSYERRLENQHINQSGMYFSWQPNNTPLDVKSEFAYSPHAYGYWLEGALKFSKQPDPDNWLKRFQTVARVQQFVRKSADFDALPGVDQQRVDFGLNYYLPHNVRFVSSYGRQFSSIGNANVWNIGFTYRFLAPLWPGSSK
jgi:hypothetical protein